MNLLLICSTFSFLLASVNGDRRIAGGNAIKIEDAPYTASIEFVVLSFLNITGDPLSYTFYCGGALISDKFVLTAAHCKANPKNSKVRLGSTTRDKGGVLVDIASSIQHPKYNEASHLDSDLAILRLKKPVAFSKTIAPIKMVNDGQEINVGEMATFSGWGDSGVESESPDFLRAVSVPIVSSKTCRAAHVEFEELDLFVTERMICAGSSNGEKQALTTDSGGPLKRISDGLLIGIVSRGNADYWGANGATNKPGVYTKISSFRGWIKNVTGI